MLKVSQMFANNWLHLLVGTLPCVAVGDNHQDISGNALTSYMAAGDAITLVPSDADDDSNRDCHYLWRDVY